MILLTATWFVFLGSLGLWLLWRTHRASIERFDRVLEGVLAPMASRIGDVSANMNVLNAEVDALQSSVDELRSAGESISSRSLEWRRDVREVAVQVQEGMRELEDAIDDLGSGTIRKEYPVETVPRDQAPVTIRRVFIKDGLTLEDLHGPPEQVARTVERFASLLGNAAAALEDFPEAKRQETSFVGAQAGVRTEERGIPAKSKTYH